MQPCAFCGTQLAPDAQSCPTCGRPAPAPRSNRGIKIAIGLAIAGGCALLAIPLLGIVAAIVIPNFVATKAKGQEKQTISDLRNIAVALEEYHSEKLVYPGGDAAAVEAALAARGSQLSFEDGWKHPLRWSCLQVEGDGCASYELVSPGKDGIFEKMEGAYEEGAFAPTDYDADLVMSDGAFLRWPENTGRYSGGG